MLQNLKQWVKVHRTHESAPQVCIDCTDAKEHEESKSPKLHKHVQPHESVRTCVSCSD